MVHPPRRRRLRHRLTPHGNTLAPERVEQAARELADLPFDELVTGGTAEGLDTAAALAAAGVYPVGLWADPSGLEYVSAHYAGLVGFLRVTARYRQGLVIRHG
ncbi:DUF1877 family protein [Kitasatospora sp. NPDC048538]|uniref:DUF1877 family protein n=1 Tax=unclassified Kitasatospora TaxID=2633591 RepID=UPI0034032B99